MKARYCNFKRYEPKDKVFETALYLKSEAGQDWYECIDTMGEDTIKIMVDSIDRIISASMDASLLFPEDCSVYEVDKVDMNALYSGRLYFIDDVVLDICAIEDRSVFVKKGIINVETEREKARLVRTELFKKLDLLDAKIASGRIVLNGDEKKEIDLWYNTWLDIPKNYSDLTIPIENTYPPKPKKIEYFD